MLKDEVALYSKLTGKDGSNVPVGIIGAYLDGYERGKVDAQPKRGRWIEDKSTCYLVCDQCRDVYINPEWLAEGKWNFCPNCGAKMEVTE